MIRVSRGSKPAPAALSKKDKDGKTEFERARAHLFPDPPLPPGSPKLKGFAYAAYKAQDVRERLEGLFRGKCAYCESAYATTAPVDIEHFRPKGAVEGEPDHPGYWWLAASWSNLLPSCIDCNRRRKQRTPPDSASLVALRAFMDVGKGTVALAGKKDCFPIAGMRAKTEACSLADEQPLLINPCEDKPEEHLTFQVGGEHPIAIVRPAVVASDNVAASPVSSRKGAVSIQIYGLNRLALVQERTKLLRQLEFLGQMALDLAEAAETVSKAAILPGASPELAGVAKRLRHMETRTLDQIRAMAEPEAPYSAMCKAWLRDFIERVRSVDN
jgi:hypothetical protein